MGNTPHLGIPLGRSPFPRIVALSPQLFCSMYSLGPTTKTPPTSMHLHILAQLCVWCVCVCERLCVWGCGCYGCTCVCSVYVCECTPCASALCNTACSFMLECHCDSPVRMLIRYNYQCSNQIL